MKVYILTFCINEAKLKAIIDRKSSPAAKEQVKKLFPVIPIVYTNTNRNGDKSQVDNWTREIKNSKTEIRREKGYIFYEARFELPNYAAINQKIYEQNFEKFVRDYVAKQNSLVGVMLITGKFFGDISVVAAVVDSIKEKKENYVDNPVNQIKEQSSNYAKFFKENQKVIIGGLAILTIGLATIAIKI